MRSSHSPRLSGSRVQISGTSRGVVWAWTATGVTAPSTIAAAIAAFFFITVPFSIPVFRKPVFARNDAGFEAELDPIWGKGGAW